MANINPFKGLRFDEKKAGKIGELVCPPYDIISEEEREEYLKKNPYNIIRLELPKGKDAYEDAGRDLKKYISDGALFKEEDESLYIYEITFVALGEQYSFMGLVCRLKVEEFEKRVVLPHEETLSKAKTDRFSLMSTTFCNFSMVYSLYIDEKQTVPGILKKNMASEPVYDFSDGECVRHRFFKVSDKMEIEALKKEFEDKQVFIADGHHRYETALNFRNHLRETGAGASDHAEDYVMMMLVEMDDPGLLVLPTHRMIRGLDGFSRDKVIEGAKKSFDITSFDRGDEMEEKLSSLKDKKAFVMITGSDSYDLFVLKDEKILEERLPDMSKALRSLDVTVLHTLILEDILGIDKENMASGKNLSYTRSASEAVIKTKSGEYQAAFILNPTKVHEIKEVALENGKMPQKSTYFYPKLITGLVVNQIKE